MNTHTHTHTHTHTLIKSVFLYINNELPEKEIKKTILSTITPKWIIYLGITSKVKYLYPENCKTLANAVKEDTNK
jgi:hypothetical protein